MTVLDFGGLLDSDSSKPTGGALKVVVDLIGCVCVSVHGACEHAHIYTHAAVCAVACSRARRHRSIHA